MRRLYRSTVDKMIAGVCGGLGEYFNIDSTIIRLLFILLLLINPVAMIIVYLIATIVIPKNPSPTTYTAKARAAEDSHIEGLTIIGLLLLIVGVLSGPSWLEFVRDIISIALVFIGLAILIFALLLKRAQLTR